MLTSMLLYAMLAYIVQLAALLFLPVCIVLVYICMFMHFFCIVVIYRHATSIYALSFGYGHSLLPINYY